MKKKSVIFASLLVLILTIQTSAVQATEVNIAPEGIPSADSQMVPLERLNDGLHPPLPYVEGPPWVFPSPTDEWSNYAWTYNFATDWGNVPRWIAYAFSTNYSVRRIVLLPYISTSGYPHYYPIDYEIQESGDGINWETIISVTDSNSPVIDYRFPSVSTRFIRIYVTRAYPWGSGFRLGATEFEVYATSLVKATVDIYPDTLNLKSKGKWITAYIEFPEVYDVEDIDCPSILLEGEIEPDSCNRPTESLVNDHDNDGIPDLMVKFDKTDVVNSVRALDLDLPADVKLTVTGSLIDGTQFEGRDTIRVIEKGGHMMGKRGR